MSKHNDYIDFIKFSLNNFSFDNYSFGKKWLNIIKKNNNVDLLLNNLENFRKSTVIIEIIILLQGIQTYMKTTI